MISSGMLFISHRHSICFSQSWGPPLTAGKISLKQLWVIFILKYSNEESLRVCDRWKTGGNLFGNGHYFCSSVWCWKWCTAALNQCVVVICWSGAHTWVHRHNLTPNAFAPNCMSVSVCNKYRVNNAIPDSLEVSYTALYLICY